jgi:hypothetical protein
MQYLMILQIFVLITSYLKEMLLNICMIIIIIAQNGMFGTWTDQQVPGVYSIYADHVMETLLVKTLPCNERKNWT